MVSRTLVRTTVAALLLAGSGCAEEPESDDALTEQVADSVEAFSPVALSNLPPGVDPAAIDVGRRAYVVCSVCHGLDGRGTQLGPSLADTSWIHISGTPQEIADIIRSGVREPAEYPVPMPVMGGGRFTEDELNGVAAYVYALSRS